MGFDRKVQKSSEPIKRFFPKYFESLPCVASDDRRSRSFRILIAFELSDLLLGWEVTVDQKSDVKGVFRPRIRLK